MKLLQVLVFYFYIFLLRTIRFVSDLVKNLAKIWNGNENHLINYLGTLDFVGQSVKIAKLTGIDQALMIA